MNDPVQRADRAIDPARVRRLFSHPRAAATDDFLAREVARRLLERLSTVRVTASRVLDVGSGAGVDGPALRGRFDSAAIVAVDAARPPLARLGTRDRRQGLARLFGRTVATFAVQADFGALPFGPQTFDVLWSNLALHWSPAPHRVLPEWARVARVGGLVAFSAFGPDTLLEVREAFADVDAQPHVMPFTDMHDYGDMLVASGFATPVVDMERLTLTYSTTGHLWADVRALGGNPLPSAGHLRGRGFRARVDAALERHRDTDGRFRLTFELLYAHAWKGEPRTTRNGDAIVRIDRRR